MTAAGAIEKLIREALSSEKPEGSVACPDPETLTSMAEDRLRGPERGEVIAHLALCAACSEVIAINARPQPVASPWRLRRLAAAAAIALVVTGAASGGLLYAKRRGEQELVRIARQALGSEVEIEAADVRIGRRLSLSFSGVRLPAATREAAEPSDAPSRRPPPVSVGQVRLEVPATALWREEDRQGQLVLVRPVVHLHRDSGGNWNVSTGTAGPSHPGRRGTNLKEKLRKARDRAPLRGLGVQEGFLQLTDHLTSPPFLAQVASISGTVPDFQRGDTLTAALSGITPGSPEGQFLGQVELRNVEGESPLETVLELTCRDTPLENAPFPPLQPLVRLDGIVDATVTVRATGSTSQELLGSATGNGSISVRAGTLRGFDLWELVLEEIASGGGRIPLDPTAETPLRTLSAALLVRGPTASITTMRIENENFRLDASGSGQVSGLRLTGTLAVSAPAYASALSSTPGIATFATPDGGAAVDLVLDLDYQGIALTLSPG